MGDIGSIVASSDHLTYFCRIYGPLEVASVPTRADYALGQFVAIPLDDSTDTHLIGMITDSVLINPEYGNYGPRLSSESDLQIFSPDTVNERGVLVTIRLVGSTEGVVASHEIPPWVAGAGSAVSVLEPDRVWAFHRGLAGELMIGYYPRLLGLRDPVIQRVLLTTLERLAASFPEEAALIRVLGTNLAWQANVGPFQ